MTKGTRVIVNDRTAEIVFQGNDTYVIVRQDGRDFAVAISDLQPIDDRHLLDGVPEGFKTCSTVGMFTNCR